MSGEDGAPDPDPLSGPPDPRRSADDRSLNMLGGVFLIGCGMCLLLLGGGCTGLLLLFIIDNHGAGDLFMLVLSLVIAAGGISAIVRGVRMTNGRGG